jgi:CheY-like chemotaxis protein
MHCDTRESFQGGFVGTAANCDTSGTEGLPVCRRETKLEKRSDTALHLYGSPPDGGPLRVLVADDNHDAVDCLALILEHWGHHVCSVHDGPSALAAVSTFGPQVVLLDIQMPKLDGYEVAERLRQEPASHDLVLIAVTGHALATDRQRAFEAGFNHYLVKPFPMEDLQQLLSTIAKPI